MSSRGNDKTIVIEKLGSVPIPVSLKIIYADNTSEIIYRTAKEWANGNSTILIEHSVTKEIKKLELGNREIPDVNKRNNEYFVER